ncbi:hypothetical protein [uncultured Streptomyces sp.]|uniref:hypothetical protein n=1 Tax=uncultured Streptomyces sp. TaxID=174707 RepID=UPI002602B7B9|nr:hypothetical protein [uncultured Streptomyces sp.]
MSNGFSQDSGKGGHTPTAGELRARAEGARQEAGKTVEALAAKGQVPAARAKELATEAKAQAAKSAAQAKTQAVEIAGQAREHLASAGATAAGTWREKSPQAVQDTAHEVADTARGNRVPLLVGAAAALVLVLVVRRRGTR